MTARFLIIEPSETRITDIQQLYGNATIAANLDLDTPVVIESVSVGETTAPPLASDSNDTDNLAAVNVSTSNDVNGQTTELNNQDIVQLAESSKEIQRQLPEPPTLNTEAEEPNEALESEPHVEEPVVLANLSNSDTTAIDNTATDTVANNIIAANTATAAGDDLDNLFEDEDEGFSFTAESLLQAQLYAADLIKRAYKEVNYPKRAIKLRQTGSVRVAVTIDREGKLIQSGLLLDSGHPQLNREVIKAVKKASPYPPVPNAISGEKYEFVVPVSFELSS